MNNDLIIFSLKIIMIVTTTTIIINTIIDY